MHRRHGGMAGFPSTAHRDSVIPALSLKLRLHMNVHKQGKSRSTRSKAAFARNEASEVATEMVGRLPVSILLRPFGLGNSTTFVHFTGIHLPVLRRAPFWS